MKILLMCGFVGITAALLPTFCKQRVTHKKNIEALGMFRKALSYKEQIQQNIKLRQTDFVELAENALQSSFSFEKDAFILKFLEKYGND